jgi:hypothetical protein
MIQNPSGRDQHYAAKLETIVIAASWNDLGSS